MKNQLLFIFRLLLPFIQTFKPLFCIVTKECWLVLKNKPPARYEFKCIWLGYFFLILIKWIMISQKKTQLIALKLLFLSLIPQWCRIFISLSHYISCYSVFFGCILRLIILKCRPLLFLFSSYMLYRFQITRCKYQDQNKRESSQTTHNNSNEVEITEILCIF